MIKLIIGAVMILAILFIYSSLVVAKRADETEYIEEEKLNWK